jgi:hypothetical protein
MNVIDRRTMMRSVLGGAAAATVAVTVGVGLMPKAAEAVPLTLGKDFPARKDDLVQEAQVVVVPPRRRRRRRWVCRWRRGRRVCTWVWV